MLQSAVVTADFGKVPDALDDALLSFRCGPRATPDQLATYWLAEGAYLALTGEAEASVDAFAAARRVAPDHWIDAYGPALEKAWQAAPIAASTGQVDVTPPPQWYTAFVDGVPVAGLPAEVESGLHLIQLGPDASDMRMARAVFVRPGAVAVAAHELVEDPRPAPAAVQEPVVPVVEAPRAHQPPVALGVAAGASVAIGRSTPTSPALQLAFPIEPSLVLRGGALWVRAAGAVAPRVGGAWDVDDDLGTGTTPTAVGAHLAVGGVTPQGDVGLLGGYQWPGRLTVAALVAVPLGASAFRIESRLGAHLLQGMEPTAQVLLAFRPALVASPRRP